MTKEKMRLALAQWKDFEPPKLVERDFDTRYVESEDILTIAGPRRAGKTFLCFQLIQGLDVPRENILYVNFEDERIYPLDGDELTVLLDIYEKLFQPSTGRKYLFLDEIQNIPNWGRWCRRIQETRKDIKLIVTGSSSKLLSKEISTELRGRTLTRIVLPYSFAEFLISHSVKYEVKDVAYRAKSAQMKRKFNEYLLHGGFPQIVSSDMKEERLREYFSTMFYKDIVERFNVGNTDLLEDFLKLLMDSFSSLASLSKMEGRLKSLGHKVSKATLKNYLSYARDVFLLFDVKRYALKRTDQIRHPVKVYAIDTGLLNAIRFSFSEDHGRYLENLVLIELMRRGKEVYYHSGNGECDFVMKEKNRIVSAIQVTKGLYQDNKNREISGLIDAMDSYGLDEGLILTDDDSDEMKVDDKRIIVKPVWLWLLERDNN